MTVVVHPHFHRRYTGATRHVEDVVPALAKHVETYAMGWLASDAVPRLRWGELLRRARREPVIWHAHRINELLVGLLLKAFGRDVRVIWSRHSAGRPSTTTALVAKRADAIVAVSPESAQTLGLAATVVTHGVDVSRFSPAAGARVDAWQALGGAGRFGVGVVGRIRPDKGQGDFVQAAAPLLRQHRDWGAALIGLCKPGDRAWLDTVCQQADMQQLLLPGEQRDIARWYRALSIVVAPSHQESFGLTRIEAMASGCCLVTTRLNALDAAIEQGRTGFVYPAGDVRALHDILESLFREPERASVIGANAAEFARARFGLDAEAEALLAVYRSAGARL